MAHPSITTEKINNVLRVSVDDGKANAFSISLLEALGDEITHAEADPDIGAVVLAVGYQLFMDWVNEGYGTEPAAEGAEEAGEGAAGAGGPAQGEKFPAKFRASQIGAGSRCKAAQSYIARCRAAADYRTDAELGAAGARFTKRFKEILDDLSFFKD